MLYESENIYLGFFIGICVVFSYIYCFDVQGSFGEKCLFIDIR